MLQNISEKYNQTSRSQTYEDNNISKINYSEIFSKLFTKQKIVIYIIAFMISMCSFGEGTESMLISPFGLAFIAAATSYGIPIAFCFIASLIGTIVKFGFGEAGAFIATSFVLLVLVLIRKPERDEEETEGVKLGGYVFASVLMVLIIKMMVKGFLFYDLLTSIMLAVSTYVFYKIFVNSIPVIAEYGIKNAFSIEEVVGASMLLAIAFSALGNLSIFSFSIRNILCIFLILFLGYRNGILVGGVSGITIGIVLGIIGAGGVNLIATYAISGLLAGLLNRFGKIGVIIGFFLGNILISYVSSGGLENMIMFQEILIAAVGLLAVPKNIKLNVDDLIPKTKLLPESTGRIEEGTEDTILKLNSISKTIDDMSNNIQKDSSYEKNLELYEDNVYKNLTGEELRNQTVKGIEEKNENLKKGQAINLNDIGKNDEVNNIRSNILYEYFVSNEGDLLRDVFESIEKNGVLTENSLISILAAHNIYVMTSEDSSEKLAEQKDLRDMLKVLNASFNDCKKDLIWQQKLNENNKKMSSGLQNVKSAIDNIKDDIKKEEVEDDSVQFERQIDEIKNLLMDEDIFVQYIKIKEEESHRKIVTCYMLKCTEEDIKNCPVKKIKRTIEKILNEPFTLQNVDCALRSEKDNCYCTFISEDKYIMQTSIARSKKDGSIVSGDTTSEAKLQDGKFLLAISDGMGSGPNARKNSKIAISMLERMLMSGFDKRTSINLINSAIMTSNNEDMYATLDVAVVDLYDGKVEFMKSGACSTYIKENNTVTMISSTSLPAGVTDNVKVDTFERELKDGSIIVMCSDGAIDSCKDFANSELWIKALLEDIQTDSPERIADIILKESLDNNVGKAKDDITVIVAKINKKIFKKY